eukprot:6204083-Pleurochrysis_carterae.AAC.2
MYIPVVPKLQRRKCRVLSQRVGEDFPAVTADTAYVSQPHVTYRVWSHIDVHMACKCLRVAAHASEDTRSSNRAQQRACTLAHAHTRAHKRTCARTRTHMRTHAHAPAGPRPRRRRATRTRANTRAYGGVRDVVRTQERGAPRRIHHRRTRSCGSAQVRKYPRACVVPKGVCGTQGRACVHKQNYACVHKHMLD